MKPVHNHGSRAFTLIELFICIAVLAVLAALLLPELRSRRRSSRLGCANNLKQIGLGFRTWALDNGDKFPMQVSETNGGTMELVESGKVLNHFLVMSNELSTPKILFCPEENDSRRTQANSFAIPPVVAGGIPFTNDYQVSYFVGVDADSKWPQMLLCGDRNLAANGTPLNPGLHSIPTNTALTWFQSRHAGGGNICFADCSVNQFNARALRGSLLATGVATNRLAIP
jgi:prepilin-type N-terminal cleavage/methylation domain-containing protein/prepilin-type processing-associated H-X9-DG protein